MRRHCDYILKPTSLIHDEEIPDHIYRKYDQLLELAWLETGAEYAYVLLSNAELAREWKMSEDGARGVLTEMRALKLIASEQVGRTGRRIRLLVAHRPSRKDSRAEVNAPRETEARWEAPATAAEVEATTDQTAFEGAPTERTLDDMPSTSTLLSFNNNLLKEKIISTNPTAREIWDATKAELQLQMTHATFDTWVRPSRAAGWGADGSFVVYAHTTYAKEWLENRLQMAIQRTVAGIVGAAVTVTYVVEDRNGHLSRHAVSSVRV